MNKCVILAGGKGIRLYPSTEDLPKPMLKINEKPLLEYVIELISGIGIKEIYIVVGYKSGLIREYFGNGNRLNVKIKYVENNWIDQKEKSGLSDAILLMRDIIYEPFMTILGDEIYINTMHKEMLNKFEENDRCDCMLAIHKTNDINAIKKNYSVKIKDDMKVIDLEEKPEKPFNDYLGCGTYIFKPAIFDYIRKTEVSQRSGRKELADTMKLMAKDMKDVRAFDIKGKYLNINYIEDLKTAEEMIKG